MLTEFKLPEAIINLDKDDDPNRSENSDFENEDSDENSSEDDEETAELLAELQRIKKERAEENLRKVIFNCFCIIVKRNVKKKKKKNKLEWKILKLEIR